MILFFDGFIRVVVASGNFSTAEWELIREVLWVQDFPLLPTSEEYPPPSTPASAPRSTTLSSLLNGYKGSNKKQCEFASILSSYLKNLLVPQKPWLKKLDSYDFSQVKCHLVCSLLVTI
jgi:hypothetical protein